MSEKTTDIAQTIGRLKDLIEQCGIDTVEQAIAECKSGASLGGGSVAQSRAMLRKLSFLKSDDIKNIGKVLGDVLKQEIPPGVEPAAEAVIELIKWIFEPTKYTDFEAKKDPQTLERVNLPEGEPRSYAPNVTANIHDVKCKREGWLEVTFQVVATSGADNDDIVSVNLSLPSTDCNGYRHKGLPHKFDTERERQSHMFTVEVKCSDLVSRSDDVVDVFIWTEVEVVDDDGNSRTVYLKLSSSKLNDVVKECCTKK